ncbi:MAG: AAA family ATPase [Candidatus Riflebacteria bacterium]|nr:AAA family ATPase [Candidatus Riflebacteria bacterium]
MESLYKPRRPRLLISSFDLEKQLRRLAESTLGAERGRWPYRPLSTSFPVLNEKIDGIRNGIYVLASAARMGKTTFALQMACDLLLKNPDAHALFVSLDQPARELNIRLVAMAGECHTAYVQNPTAKDVEKYDVKRQTGLSKMLQLKSRLTVVDESLGSLGLADLVSFIHQIKGRKKKPLVVFLDPYYKIRLERQPEGMEHRSERLMSELRSLASAEEIGIVATTRLSRGAGLQRPTLEELEEQPGVLYDSHVLGLLYCDAFNNGDTPFLEWEWGTDDVMVPIFELDLCKNKMGAFSGRLYYRFYTSYSKFKECSELEIDNYNRMLMNLKVHDKSDPIVDETGSCRVDHIDETNT